MAKIKKFRGITTDSKAWVYGDLFHAKSGLTIIENDGTCQNDFNFIVPETAGMLLHTTKDGREWYEGDKVKLTIHVPPTSYHDGSGWLNNTDEFNAIAIGTLCFHPRLGICIKDYVLTDIDSDTDVEHSSKYKTISFSRAEIIGTIHEER